MEVDIVEMGRRIAQRRKAFQLKQKDLAEKIGVSNNHLSDIELGKSSPSLNVFVRICTELDVTPDYLLEGTMRSNNGRVDKVLPEKKLHKNWQENAGF